MEQMSYISVILPLKLEWEPCYSVLGSMMPIDIGNRVRVIFAGKEYIGVVSATGITPETELSRIRPITDVERGMDKILPQEIELWRKVSDYYLCSIGEVYKAAYPIGKVHLEEAKAKADEKTLLRREKAIDTIKARIERLESRLTKKEEQIAKARKDSTRDTYLSQADGIRYDISQAENQLSRLLANPDSENSSQEAVSCHPTLTGAQTTAYNSVLKAFSEGKPALIHGITGSGKTEIYTKLAADSLSKGRNVLYMVPEIALSRQLEERLYSYFGERLMTFHSAQTAAGKRDIADRIRNSGKEDCYIVLGTRSSIFLPHHDLGLIIIDEEHDNSYKQDSPAPRYNGRDTALMLSRIHDSDVIMGSATPSLESLYNCQAGKHRLIELNERFHGSEDSEIEMIDTKAERRKKGMRGSFSIKLIEHIRRTLDAGGQTIILRSRRSYAPALQCQECGELQKCPHCNVSLSWHRPQGCADAGKTVCHHCGWNAPFKDSCSSCGGKLIQFGAGTQKIEEEAAALFPQARIARLDSDTAQNKSFEAKTIRDFSNGDIDILIGTQIISKGFDFSNLSLVVIIAADTLLSVQDFRADEKAIQLLEQLRGRCGRRGSKGTFVIQTSQPQHPVYQRMANNDSRQFSIDLLNERKDFGFPPYSRIIAITIRDRYEDRANRMTYNLAARLKNILPDTIGPFAPNPDKIADLYIRCIRVSLPKDKSLASRKALLKKSVEVFEKELRYTGHITIDVDPA